MNAIYNVRLFASETMLSQLLHPKKNKELKWGAGQTLSSERRLVQRGANTTIWPRGTKEKIKLEDEFKNNSVKILVTLFLHR